MFDFDQDSALGALSASPDPIAGFKGAYFKGEGGRGTERRGGKRRRGEKEWRSGYATGRDSVLFEHYFVFWGLCTIDTICN